MGLFDALGRRIYDDKDPAEEARELGLIMVDSENRLLKPHLQIDLDDAQALHEFSQRLPQVMSIDCWLTEAMGQVHYTTSKSGGRHVYILLKHTLPQEDRIFLQALLASDPKREMLSWRGRRNSTGPLPRTVLFETHEEAACVWAFLAKDPVKSLDVGGLNVKVTFMEPVNPEKPI